MITMQLELFVDRLVVGDRKPAWFYVERDVSGFKARITDHEGYRVRSGKDGVFGGKQMSEKPINITLRRLGLKATGDKTTSERTITERGQVVFKGTERMVWQWLRDSDRLPYMQPPSVRQILSRSIRDSDNWACRILYRDAGGIETVRTISPVRFTNNDRTVLALCIGRQENRQFSIRNIVDIQLVDASTVLMGDDSVWEVPTQ
jgi:hypothetical protein